MKANKLIIIAAVATVFCAGTAFAGEHHRRHERNNGIRLATDIVNLVKSVVAPVPVVVAPPPPVTVHQPPPPPRRVVVTPPPRPDHRNPPPRHRRG